jgi:hypothetical protein
MRILRSMLAILAGLVVLTVTSFAIEWAADPILLRLFPRALPNSSALETNLYASLFMYLYTAFCVAAGGYMAAWIARRSPVAHAVAVGVIELALTIWAMEAVVTHAPLRNWIVGIVTVVPAAWIGGLLRIKRSRKGGVLAANPTDATA